MSSTDTFSAKRRRSWAVSVAVMTAMFSGLTSVSASAQEDIVVSGTVEDCTISITSDPGPIALGAPEFDTPNYVFREADAITVSWEISGAPATDCAGELHAEHLGIMKDGATPTFRDGEHHAWMNLSTDAFATRQSINEDSVSLNWIVTPTPGNSGESEAFGVELLVSSSEGAGVYSATIRFTVAFVGP